VTEKVGIPSNFCRKYPRCDIDASSATYLEKEKEWAMVWLYVQMSYFFALKNSEKVFSLEKGGGMPLEACM